MRLLIVVLLALLAAVLAPLIAHSEGLSWSGTETRSSVPARHMAAAYPLRPTGFPSQD